MAQASIVNSVNTLQEYHRCETAIIRKNNPDRSVKNFGSIILIVGAKGGVRGCFRGTLWSFWEQNQLFSQHQARCSWRKSRKKNTATHLDKPLSKHDRSINGPLTTPLFTRARTMPLRGIYTAIIGYTIIWPIGYHKRSAHPHGFSIDLCELIEISFYSICLTG